MGSLKTFIRNVRKSKTIADERAVIKKESASIRTSFRDAGLDHTTRRINISKLLYLYILGEKTHFGQVECLKLLASPRFADKRLGYLATTLLLDENQEVLTLLTNSLDNDMQHPNPFIVGIALCCLGSVASADLARDLHGNVERIFSSNNPYLKKKACFVAAKLIDRDPDLAEIFMPKIDQLIGEKLPSILLGVSRLIQAIYDASPDSRPTLVRTVPRIVGHIKRVVSTGYLPDYDILGVTDPFLQVSLLTTLRTLAMDSNCSEKYLEEINDILTQVASNIDTGKNPAHAVLYECIKTIFTIRSDQSLKVLGVNLLGKFLSSRDNNTKYVALNTLLTVISIEPQAVQRHRSTIVSCLSDGDISIRRRALELSFAILNESNVRVLVREILQFLENCQDNELKPYITSQLIYVSDKFSPNQKWHFDTLTRMLKLAGSDVSLESMSHILALLMQCKDIELKKHVITKLVSSWLHDSTQFCLSLVTVWTLGEYGDLVLDSGIYAEDTEKVIDDTLILSIIESSINNTTFTESETTLLVSYVLTAIIKLSIKFKRPESIERLRVILNSKIHDTNLEIQTRAVEYKEIFTQDLQLKKGILAKMPPPVMKEVQTMSLQGSTHQKSGRLDNAHAKNSTDSGSDLLDLMDDNTASVGETNYAANSQDLLKDIFGDVDKSNSNPTSVINGNESSKNNIFDLFNPAPNHLGAVHVPEASKVPDYANSNIAVTFIPRSVPQNGLATIEAIVKGQQTDASIEDLQLLIAVPKSQKLTIASAAGDNSLSNGKSIKQLLKITGKQGSKIKLRVKITYTLNHQNVEDMFDFAGIKETL